MRDVTDALIAGVAGGTTGALGFKYAAAWLRRRVAGDSADYYSEAEFYDEADPHADPELCACGDLDLREYVRAWSMDGMEHHRDICVEGDPPPALGPEWP
jgi:hypothetical protein